METKVPTMGDLKGLVSLRNRRGCVEKKKMQVHGEKLSCLFILEAEDP